MSSHRITLQLPQEFVDLCAGHGVAPDRVLRGFIADLCGITSYALDPRNDGYASNGSDERALAYDYYDRVGYPYWNLDP